MLKSQKNLKDQSGSWVI